MAWQGLRQPDFKPDETAPSNQEIVLDIEPVIKTAKNYSQRINRLLFYKHNGFKLTQDNLVDEGGHYAILSSDKHFKKRNLSQLLKRMSFNCYKFKIVSR